MATLTANPIDVLASSPPVAIAPPKKAARRIRFAENPVSDVFIVNRIAEELILTMFYQPEDFARWRYERNLELAESKEKRFRRPRCSMDLTKNNLSVPLAPRAQMQPNKAQSRIQRPAVVHTCIAAPVSPMRSLSPMRGGARGAQRGRGPRNLSPLRPCSQGRRSRGPAGKKPMALAA